MSFFCFLLSLLQPHYSLEGSTEVTILPGNRPLTQRTHMIDPFSLYAVIYDLEALN